MPDKVKLTLEMEDILSRPTEEQIKDLVRIAFMNHALLAKHSEILFGNGKEGLCEKFRKTTLSIWFLWTSFVGVGGAIIGVLYAHLVVK
jgi:hypothetical protein